MSQPMSSQIKYALGLENDPPPDLVSAIVDVFDTGESDGKRTHGKRWPNERAKFTYPCGCWNEVLIRTALSIARCRRPDAPIAVVEPLPDIDPGMPDDTEADARMARLSGALL